MNCAAFLITFVFIVFDFFSGLVKAFATNHFTSTKMREGLFHKIGLVLCVVLGYLIDEVGDLLSEYATDVNTLYSKAEKFGNGERVNSDVREYYNRRGEFKLLQHEIVVGLKQPSEKDSEDFFERYRYY